MRTLCALVFQLGTDYAIFIPMVNKALSKNQIAHAQYEGLVSCVLKNQPLNFEPPSDPLSRRRKKEVGTDCQNATELHHRSSSQFRLIPPPYVL